MNVTTSVNNLKHIKKCADLITIEAYASPLLNANHVLRFPLNVEGVECGTTMPAILFAGMKLKLMANSSVSSEADMLSLDKSVRRILRHLLTEIHYLVLDDNDMKHPISASKTFHEKVFRHIVWDEPLMMMGESDVVRTEPRSMSHTVTMVKTTSFTVPSYLCKWALEKDGLSVHNKYSDVNPYLRRIASDIYNTLKGVRPDRWKKYASFSRKVQNAMLVSAFKGALSQEQISATLINRKK